MSSGPHSRLSPPSTRRLLIRTLLATLALFLALEIWRPYYFLTDDNLSAGLPFLTEMGRHLKSGQSPFYSDYLFGGHYNLLRDANYFSWSPIYFIVSLLADTPGRFAMLDLIALFNILLSAAGFALLAARTVTGLIHGTFWPRVPRADHARSCCSASSVGTRPGRARLHDYS